MEREKQALLLLFFTSFQGTTTVKNWALAPTRKPLKSTTSPMSETPFLSTFLMTFLSLCTSKMERSLNASRNRALRLRRLSKRMGSYESLKRFRSILKMPLWPTLPRVQSIVRLSMGRTVGCWILKSPPLKTTMSLWNSLTKPLMWTSRLSMPTALNEPFKSHSMSKRRTLSLTTKSTWRRLKSFKRATSFFVNLKRRATP